MPIYEYQCESCCDRFEYKQNIKDDPLTACPRCGKPVQRLISSSAIMFKGSGWYVTDYSDKLKPSSDNDKPIETIGEKGEKKDTAPSTSGQTTPATPSAPASSSTSAPGSAPSSATSGTSTTAPAPSTTNK